MQYPLNLVLALFALPLSIAAAQAAEFTGRLSLLGLAAKPEAGDSGYTEGESDSLSADQLGLRLMLDDILDRGEWALHVRATRQHFDGFPRSEINASNLFRYKDLRENWIDQSDGDNSTRAGIELDHAYYRHQTDKLTLTAGRQPLDWGSGRFWQPLNLFGAFMPTDLDTDYKPGIDGLVLDWYPSSYASFTAAYMLSPQGDNLLEDSAAAYYRRQVGQESEVAAAAGSISGNHVAGGSFESVWKGIGWRIEGAYYDLQEGDSGLFAIAGIDYQFDEGTAVALEWYRNDFGASRRRSLAAETADPLVVFQLQPLLTKTALGATVDRELTPLLRATYLLLTSSVKDAGNDRRYSFLHQLNFIYSIADEADFLASVLLASGDGLADDKLQSEFGHIPKSLTLRLRFYF